MLLDAPKKNHTRREWPKMPFEERIAKWLRKVTSNNADHWQRSPDLPMSLPQRYLSELGLKSADVTIHVNGHISLLSDEVEDPLVIIDR